MNALQSYDFDQLKFTEILIGVDEAGRGCLAGPVVAGACLLGRAFFDSDFALQASTAINDSKQMKPKAREAQMEVIDRLKENGLLDYAVASASVEEIEAFNILGATRLAMRRAIEALQQRAEDWDLPKFDAADSLFADQAEGRGVRVIVDGRSLKPFPYAHEGVVKGDGKSLSIAMASIAAKVSRDRAMASLDEAYPAYGFARHKGYGTHAHRAALKAHGASPMHRSLFLRKVL